VILWIYRGDSYGLPRSVQRLQRQGLTIRLVDVDTRSYKKLVPALADYRDCFIATADDDVVYPDDWLAQLVHAVRPDEREVVGLRGRWITETGHGAFAPYESWPLVDGDSGASGRIVLTGVGGILYPPGCFGPEVADAERFLSLCPRADDLWFYFQLRSNGYLCRKVGDLEPLETVAGSQTESLWSANRSGHNDASWARLVGEFGNPMRGRDEPPAARAAPQETEDRATRASAPADLPP
jgi:hypothetical protein